MMRLVMILLMAMLAMNAAIVQAENQISVSIMPPIVVQTFPQAGETSVDPAINEIRVTFS